MMQQTSVNRAAALRSSRGQTFAIRDIQPRPRPIQPVAVLNGTIVPVQHSSRASRPRRLLTVRPRCQGSARDSGAGPAAGGGDEQPLYLPATASTYCPFSAELLLATTRLGHLERYREEVMQVYEPGMPVDLARAALLVSNIYQPQLDHKPYFQALEYLLAAASLAVMRKVAPGQDGSCEGFEGLDLRDPQLLLAAAQGINEVLLEEEGLHINTADPWDPLNGSLADLLDTHRGNQWTLAVVYLHVLEGLGLPCALMGSAQHAFVRVGEPPVLLQPNSSTSSSSRPPAFLLDMAQPGVVYAYPPPVPAGSNSTLQPADSLASNGSSSSSIGRVTEEWNMALHAFLQRRQQDASTADSPMDDASTNDADRLAGTGSRSSSNSSSDAIAEEFTEGSNSDGSSAWQELEVYAAEDVATRNSWKALYGPGALTEWGGSVTSSWHYYQHSSSAGSWDGGPQQGTEGGATIGGMRAAEWLGVLDSPFAHAAHNPFPEEAADAAPEAAAEAAQGVTGSNSSSNLDSMDTSCGSPAATLDDTFEGARTSTIEDSSSSSDGNNSVVSSDCEGVIALSWADVAAIGGLQPVSKRMLLQQLLGGMKLSLMMSGRQEELLLVLRYLRATDPFCLPDLRDMALCLAEQRPEEAAPLLHEYLAVAPGAPDADMVAEVLAQVQLRVQLGRSKGW